MRDYYLLSKEELLELFAVNMQGHSKAEAESRL